LNDFDDSNGFIDREAEALEAEALEAEEWQAEEWQAEEWQAEEWQAEEWQAEEWQAEELGVGELAGRRNFGASVVSPQHITARQQLRRKRCGYMGLRALLRGGSEG
jgi:hypothetical protein